MLRLRWFDREPDDLSAPVDWRFAVSIIATQFLNFSFWIATASDLWMSCSLPLYAVHVGVVALLIAALFFVGPALAAQASARPLFSAVENSLGSIPAYGVRFCCVLFLLAWTAKLIAWAELWPLHIIRPQGWSPIESGAIGIGVMGLLAFTSLRVCKRSATLALFMNKLGAAILIAALIRVHHGWPAVLTASSVSAARSEGLELWQGLSQLAFYLAPSVFLAASFGYRSAGRKTVAMTALMGIAAPLAGTLILVGIIGIATMESGFLRTQFGTERRQWHFGGAIAASMALAGTQACWPQSQCLARYASGLGRSWNPHRYVLSEDDGRWSCSDFLRAQFCWSPPIHTLQPLIY